MFIVLALLIPLFLGTFQLSNLVVFQVMLLLCGLVGTMYVNRRIEYDSEIDEEERTNIFMATIGAIVGISAIGLATSRTFFTTTTEVPVGLATVAGGLGLKLYAALMAISEEVFFRGFLTGLFNSKLGRGLGALAVAVTGTVYHLARYGADPNALMFIFGSFLLLSVIATRTQRLSPTILAHVIHNMLVA